MTGQFTLDNYANGEYLKNPQVIVSDGGFDSNLICITVEDKVVKVDGKEMIKAIQNLMRINYSYTLS